VVTERNPAIVECYREVALHFQNKDRIRLRAMVLIRTKFLSAILKMIQREGCHPYLRERLEVMAAHSNCEIAYIEFAIRKLPPDLKVVSSNP
jgi:hypothetical protein